MRLSRQGVELFLSHIKFSWSAFLLYAIASTLSVVLRLDGFRLTQGFITNAALMGLMITSATAILLLFGFLIVQRLLPEKTWALVPMLLTVGGIRGAILYWEIDVMGFQNKIPLPGSIMSSTFYTAIYYAGASFVVEARSRKANQFQREFLLATLATLDAEKDTPVASPEAEYEMMLTKIRSAVNSTSSYGTTDVIKSEGISEIADRVRDQIQEVLRPLSHRLWISTAGEIRTKNSKGLIKESIEGLDFSATFILLYQIMVGIFGIGLSIGFTHGIIKTVAASIGSFITICSYRYAKDRMNLDWKILSTLFLLGMAIVPITLSEILSYSLEIPVYVIAAMLVAPTLPILVVINSLYNLVSKDRQFALAAAKVVKFQAFELASPKNANLTVKDLAGYIHNNLQADLLRISHKLDKAARAGNESNPGALLQELEQVLGRSLQDISDFQLEGMERIKALPHVWRGIADIELRNKLEEKLAPERCALLVGVVEEMVTNSIRHGEATDLSIDIEESSLGIQVMILHNGRGKVQSTSGLGSVFLSHAAISGPIISRAGGLTKYSIQL